MKVLWICNIIFPEISEEYNVKSSVYGGWIISSIKALSNNKSINLCVLSVYNGKRVLNVEKNNVKYFLLPKSNLISSYKQIVESFLPDIIHIHGTEYSYKLDLMKLYPGKKHIVSIQGLTYYISKHIEAGLPSKVHRILTLRGVLFRDSIKGLKHKFERNGKIEIEIIRETDYIIGRTTWDKACTFHINPTAKYFHCNESLRDEFYNYVWNYESCQKYSIYLSQASYSIKGFHFLIEAMNMLKSNFPEMHLYIGGISPVKKGSILNRLKVTPYGKYIKRLIKRYRLNDNITFLGEIDEKAVCNRLLSSNVFVLPSTIENSPNSLAEAMILGVPCITSCVGGVQDMIKDREEGYIYPWDEPYMLAYYLRVLFTDIDIAYKYSKNARKRAIETHNREKNMNNIIEIYHKILSK